MKRSLHNIGAIMNGLLPYKGKKEGKRKEKLIVFTVGKMPNPQPRPRRKVPLFKKVSISSW